jgi:sugar phosphate isomerase/epimerase
VTSTDPGHRSPGPLLPGIGSFAFGWAVGHTQQRFDEHAVLDFARVHGLRVVQIGDNLPVHTWAPERLERFTRATRAADISIELGARGLTEAHLAEYLNRCADCGARLLRFVADASSYHPSADDVIAILKNAAPVLAEAGVTLALENHERFPAVVLRRIVEDAGSPNVGICLDTANSLGAGEGLGAVTDVLAPLTVNLHVKDVQITRLPHMMGFVVEGRPLGAGQLAIASTIEKVLQHGRCRTVILEAWTPPAETIEQTIEQEFASAVVSAERLKALLSDSPP